MFDLESLYKSLVRHVQTTRQKIIDEGISPGLSYYSWDSRGEKADLPEGDLIGLAGWSFKENGGLWLVRAGITMSTFNDENLFREIAMVNIVHDMWGEQTQIPMVNKTTGEEFTVMVVTDFDMMPAGTSEFRNYRPIMVELLRTSE